MRFLAIASEHGLPRLLDLESISTARNIGDGDGEGVARSTRAELIDGHQVGRTRGGAFEVDLCIAAVAVPGQGDLLTGADAVEIGIGELDSGGEERHQSGGHKGDKFGREMHFRQLVDLVSTFYGFETPGIERLAMD